MPIENALNLTWNKQEFASVEGTNCNLGIVVFVRRNSEFVTVRKSIKEDYAFSSRLSLPGGMVRKANDTNIGQAIRSSALARLKSETGLQIPEHTEIDFPSNQIFPITSYRVKADDKFTLIATATLNLNGLSRELEARDESISQVFWQPCEKPNWEEFTPGNLLIVYEILKAELPLNERKRAMPYVIMAQTQCNEWARACNLPQFASTVARLN